MTTEEKAKAYDEALNWMHEIYPELHGATKEDAEHFFPELTESEDERVIKALETFINQPEIANKITFEARIGWLTWLEKQKENHKSVDSIPTDCTSDVRYEDRWHKVEDSFPDNGRLVLANDCLGNILLARYDGEGNWEVSVYDNEDYYCRNTITKWCEIPSEKQKEQNPTSFNEPYNPDDYEVIMEGNATSLKQKEHQSYPDAPKEKSVGGNFYSSDKDKNLDEIAQDYVDGVKQYNQEPTWDLMQTAVCYGYHLSEEQFEKNRLANCDAVSKEECDRETGFAMEIIEKEHRQPTFNDAINYGMRLQKQKEQKPLTTEETELNSIAFLEQMGYTCIPPRKEQKPVEKQDYSGLNDLERAILRGFLSAGVENVTGTTIKETAKECLAQIKTAEWDEEDREIAQNIMVFLKEPTTAELCPQLRKECQDWLKSLPERFNLQPKQEWSEEDEGELQNAIDALEFLGKKGVYKSESGYDAALQAAFWLKSLLERFVIQPKSEWSEDDKAIVGCIACYLDGQFITEGARKQCQEWFNRHRRDFLNSSSWKPSDEQKEALEYVIRDYREDGCNATANYLQEILDHLKNM